MNRTSLSTCTFSYRFWPFALIPHCLEVKQKKGEAHKSEACVDVPASIKIFLGISHPSSHRPSFSHHFHLGLSSDFSYFRMFQQTYFFNPPKATTTLSVSSYDSDVGREWGGASRGVGSAPGAAAREDSVSGSTSSSL